MGNLSIKLNKEKIDKIKETFKEYITNSPSEYIETFIQKEGLTISIYKNGKVLFQGDDALFYGESFIDNKFVRQAGSDEVGTGDFFGPVVVVAAIVEEKDESLIKELKVVDSKELDDNKILNIGPKLIESIKHSALILDNVKYNNAHQKYNLNEIKAMLHNKAYLNLINKGYTLPPLCYIDDFCGEAKYFEYLSNEKEVYRNLIFETKAENKYEAVAVASCIARFIFLNEINKMEQKYEIKFTKGASDIVIEDAKRFISKYGKDRLNEVCKLHFKNYKEIN